MKEDEGSGGSSWQVPPPYSHVRPFHGREGRYACEWQLTRLVLLLRRGAVCFSVEIRLSVKSQWPRDQLS